ncbi:hypothetical protein ACFQ4C_20165 [Larkinella insperata]|uniref:DUF1351 domain-containing protein n=1 Tax=Larkinella insperata TaxID=332158 RepID=A0ABW3QCN6_9BACT|nr:hypothetical protein [Larkinella insperata]
MTDETVQEAVVIPGPETPIVFSVTDAAINQMKAELLSLTIPAQEDREGYKHIVEARKMVKKTRLDVGKKHDEMTEEAKSYVKRVKAEADRIVGSLKPIELHLQSLEDAYDAEKERIRKQKEIEAQARIENRVNRLRSAGMIWDGVVEMFILLQEHKISWEDIKNLPDDQFEPLAIDIEDRYKAYLEAEAERKRLEEEEAARKEAERIAEEKRIQAERDRQSAELKAENDRLEKLRKEQAELQRQLDEQAAELQRQQDVMRLERERLEELAKPKETEPVAEVSVLPDREPSTAVTVPVAEAIPQEPALEAHWATNLSKGAQREWEKDLQKLRKVSEDFGAYKYPELEYVDARNVLEEFQNRLVVAIGQLTANISEL